MAHFTDHLAGVPSQRLVSLIAPREHGAWGLLLVPLATGGAVGLLRGGNAFPLAAFTVAALSLFWLRTPFESLLGASPIRAQSREQRRSVAIVILLLGKVAACSLLALLWAGHNRHLLLLGVAAVLAFFAQFVLRKLSRRTRMLSQVVGILGLTITAPAAYYIVTAHLDRTAWLLWAANFFFAANQVHFVQLRIHSARLNSFAEKFAHGWSFLLAEGLLLAALLAACYFQLLPLLATLAFLPLLVRGGAWFFEGPKPLQVRRLGWTELTHAIVFGTLLVLGFYVAV